MEAAGFTPAAGPIMEAAGFTPAAGPIMEAAGFTPAAGPIMEAAGFTPAAGPIMEAAGFTPAAGPIMEAAGVTPAAGPIMEAGGFTPAAGIDEQIGRAAACEAARRYERAQRGGAERDDRPAARDERCGIVRNRVALAMHVVRANVVGADRLERAVADM